MSFRYRQVGRRGLRVVCQGCGEFMCTTLWTEERSAPSRAGKSASWQTLRQVNLCIVCGSVAEQCSADGRRLLRLGDLP